MSYDNSLIDDIRTVLNRDWDPLDMVAQGLSDEYDYYIPMLVCMIRCGCTRAEIANYLLLMERQRMSIHKQQQDDARVQLVADHLLDIVKERTGQR